MIPVDHTLISDDLYLVRFACPIEKCKGACCVEGDAGAPLTEEEIAQLEDHIEDIKPFMTDRGIREIEETGIFDYDAMADFVTPLVKGLECAFTNFKDEIAYCAIEKAYEEGVIYFQKPVSCHLYPIRIQDYSQFAAVNYHHWEICDDACSLGKELQVPVYKFVKQALVRKFGEAWYKELEEIAEQLKK